MLAAFHPVHLLERMLNPHLRDTVERVTRDARRKLGWSDRLVGTMRLALEHGITPRGYAAGAAAAWRAMREEEPGLAATALADTWRAAGADEGEVVAIAKLIEEAERGWEEA